MSDVEQKEQGDISPLMIKEETNQEGSLDSREEIEIGQEEVEHTSLDSQSVKTGVELESFIFSSPQGDEDVTEAARRFVQQHYQAGEQHQEDDLDPLHRPLGPLPQRQQAPEDLGLADGDSKQTSLLYRDEEDSKEGYLDTSEIFDSTVRRTPPPAAGQLTSSSDETASTIAAGQSSTVESEDGLGATADRSDAAASGVQLEALTQERIDRFYNNLRRAQEYLAQPVEFEYKVMRTREQQQKWLQAQKLDDPACWLPENHEENDRKIHEFRVQHHAFEKEVTSWLAELDQVSQRVLPVTHGLKTSWTTLSELGRATEAFEEFEERWESGNKKSVVPLSRVQMCPCVHGVPDMEDKEWEALAPEQKWKQCSLSQFKHMAVVLGEKGRILNELWNIMKTLKEEWRGIRDLVEWKSDLKADILHSGAKIVISKTDQAYAPLEELPARLQELRELLEARHNWVDEQHARLWEGVEKSGLQERIGQLEREVVRKEEKYRESCEEIKSLETREERSTHHYRRVKAELEKTQEDRDKAQRAAGEWQQACEARLAELQESEGQYYQLGQAYEDKVAELQESEAKYDKLKNAYEQLEKQLKAAEAWKTWYESQYQVMKDRETAQEEQLKNEPLSAPTRQPPLPDRSWDEFSLQYSEKAREREPKVGMMEDDPPSEKPSAVKKETKTQQDQYTSVPSSASTRLKEREPRPSHVYHGNYSLSSAMCDGDGATGGQRGSDRLRDESLDRQQGPGAPSRSREERYSHEPPLVPPVVIQGQQDPRIVESIMLQSEILREMKEEKAVPYPRSFPKFSGKAGDSWTSWLKRFSVAFHEVRPEKKALALWNHLEGKAFDVVTGSIETGARDVIPPYEAMVEALNARYVPRGLEDQAYAQLFSRKQKPGEDLRDYADALTKLYETANPAVGDNVYKRQILQAAFLSGIHDPMVEVSCRAWCSEKTGYVRLSELAAHATGLKKEERDTKKDTQKGMSSL